MANGDFYRCMAQADSLSVDERLLLAKLLLDRVSSELLAAAADGPERRIAQVRREGEDAQDWIDRIRQDAPSYRSVA